MRAFVVLIACWLGIAGMARGEEGIRLAPGFGLQRLPAALMPMGEWPAIPALCVRKDGLWFASRENLYRLGMRAGALEVPLSIEGFACSAQGSPVLVVAGKLGPVQGRLFVPRVPLPSPASRVVGGAGDSLILFETTAPARVFRFDGRQSQLVATLAEPIQAAAPAGDFVLAATPSGIYRMRSGEPLGLLFPLADMKPVVSLAVHPRTAEILFATEDEIFLLDDGRATQLTAGLGGVLATTDAAIFIADGRRRGIYALAPAR